MSFEEEIEDVQQLQNPDDDYIQSAGPLLEATNTTNTPKRPSKSRKRKRKVDCEAAAGSSSAVQTTDDATSSTIATGEQQTRKMITKKERACIISHIKKCPVLELVKVHFQKNESAIFQELLTDT